MSREESARRFVLPAPFSSLSENHLEIFSWLTAINTGWSWYLFSCGQHRTTRILHSSSQSKFKIGVDNAWEERGERICVWACKTLGESPVNPGERHTEERRGAVIYLGGSFDQMFLIRISESVITSPGFWDFISHITHTLSCPVEHTPKWAE